MPLLRACLDESSRGRWGLFGQNDHIDAGHGYWRWEEADRLKNLAAEIHAIRIEFGQPNSVCERFLHLCSLRGANVAGEPKLARDFLEELELADS